MYESLFLISLFFIGYSYLIYPGLLVALVQFKRSDEAAQQEGDYYPTVSVVIAAYNEEKVIERKILNSLSLDYPSDKVEILIGSDGSTDGTDAICKRFEKCRFMRIEPRQGKSNVLNELIPAAEGEIIVLTDANTIMDPGALRKLVKHFADAAVGAVCGKLVLLQNESARLESCEGIYWRYESAIKEMESKIFSTVGANGGIYAIRRELYTPINKDTIIDDFLISLTILEQGKRIVFEKEAVAYEYVSKRFLDEFWRKVRIGAGNLQVLLRKRLFFKSASLFVPFAYISHKVVRWCIPFLLITLYLASLRLYGHGVFTYFFWAYNFAILITVAAVVFQVRNWIINLISYLFVLNLALLLGYVRYIFRLQKATWRKAAR